MVDVNGSMMTGPAAAAIQEASAYFLSKLKSKFRTSEGAINFVIEEINSLTALYLNFIEEELTEKCILHDGHLTLEKIFSKLDALQGQSLFEGVGTKPYLDSFVAHRSTDNKPSGLNQIIFDTKVVFRNGIPHKVPKDFAYFPPFLPQLEQLLNCKDVLHCVDNPRESVNGVFKSVTDGYFYRFHYIVRQHGNKVLCIIIYVDDVEFADPCKSKTKKHKLRLFYWTLGNIYPELRSTLKAINLLGIATYEVAQKWGNEEILKYFVKDMTDLANGVKLCINNEERVFHGILQFVAADIPAAANLGGMKESHFALRPCRMCMTTRFELCDHFNEVEGMLRKLETHNKYCDEIEGFNVTNPPAITLVSVELNEEGHDYVDIEEEATDMFQDNAPQQFNDHADPSVNYGISKRSFLAEIPGFDVTKCLPYDILHCIFEGCAEDLCRLILKDLCTRPKPPPQDPSQPKKRKRKQEKPKMTLKQVNHIIQEASDFGHLGVSKPSPIEKSHLKTKLKQSASQMIVLVHFLPIIAFGKIASEKLELVGQLIKIISLVMKFEATEEDENNLECTVQAFGQNFVNCYPDFKTLKLHSLKHLKMQIFLHGPLRQQACFRFEAMHRLFTRLVDIINNMKNIEFSLACRHLSERHVDILNGKHDGTFLYPGDIVRKSPSVKLKTLPEKNIVLQTFPELDEEVEVAFVNRFETHGRIWHKDVVFSLQNTQAGSDHIFGIIVKMYFIGNEMVFVFNKLKVNFLENFCAYEVTGRDNNILACLRLSSLNLQYPILKFTVQLGINRTRSFLVCGSSGTLS